MRDLLLMVGAAFAYVAGGICMKYSEGLTRLWPSISLFLLFCIGAALQALAMRSAQLGPTYVFVLGLEAVLAFLLGILLFNEPATGIRILAVALITTGILLLKSR